VRKGLQGSLLTHSDTSGFPVAILVGDHSAEEV